MVETSIPNIFGRKVNISKHTWKIPIGLYLYYLSMVDKNHISERVEQLQNETLLSDRESEVFARMERGFTTNRIAMELEISESSVESHKSNLKERLGKAKVTVDNVNLEEPITPTEFISKDMIEPEVMALFWAAIENEVPILIADKSSELDFWDTEGRIMYNSGGELLDSILQFIPDDEPVVSDTLDVLQPFEVRDTPKFKHEFDENRVVKHYPQDTDYNWLIDEYSNSGVYTTMDEDSVETVAKRILYAAPRTVENLTNSLIVSLNQGSLSIGDNIINTVSVVTGTGENGISFENVVTGENGKWFMNNKHENLEEMGIYNDINERVEYLEELEQDSLKFDGFASAMRRWQQN